MRKLKTYVPAGKNYQYKIFYTEENSGIAKVMYIAWDSKIDLFLGR